VEFQNLAKEYYPIKGSVKLYLWDEFDDWYYDEDFDDTLIDDNDFAKMF